MKRMSASQYQAKFGPKYKPGLSLSVGRKLGKAMADLAVQFGREEVANAPQPERNPLAVFVPVRVPGLNEFAHGHHWGKRAKIKKEWRGMIEAYGMALPWMIAEDGERRRVSLVIHEPNKRRDPDNVISGAWKIILDGLVMNGFICNDNAKGVELGEARIVYDKTEGVEIMLNSV